MSVEAMNTEAASNENHERILALRRSTQGLQDRSNLKTPDGLLGSKNKHSIIK